MFQRFSYAEPVETNVEFRPGQTGFHIATTGALTVKFGNGATATFTALQAGTQLFCVCREVTSAPANTLVLYE